MTVTDSDIIAILESLIPETSSDVVTEAAKSDAVQAALDWHSRLNPKYTVQLGTADGTKIYSAPTRFLSISRIEVPYGSAPPVYLAGTAWDLHYGTAGYEIVFATDPGSGEVFAIHYDAYWDIGDIDTRDKNKIAYLAAAWLSLRRAALSASDVGSVITANNVNYSSQAKRWMELADKFITFYATSTGISAKHVMEGAVAPASGLGRVPQFQLYDRVFWGDGS